MNRAEIAVELERIVALLDGAVSESELAEARRGLGVLGEVMRAGEASEPDGCPFEPGKVQLVGLQWRTKPAEAGKNTNTNTNTKTKRKKKKKGKRKSNTKMTGAGASAQTAATPRRGGDGAPLTGRIAAMVRDGVPAEEIVALYRVRPEHVAAFVDAFITPARPRAPAATSGADDLIRCPTPS